MKAISELVVRICDLVEAEGRALVSASREQGRNLLEVVQEQGRTLLETGRDEAQRVRAAINTLAVGFMFLLIATPLLIAGVGLILAGVMLWLEPQVGRPAAAAITGLLTLAAGGVCVWQFKRATTK